MTQQKLDREKVIKGLENCIGQPKCKDCPWEECELEHEVVNSVPYGLMCDALALLKEREPVKPIRINSITDGFSFAYACGKCCYFLPRIGIAAKYCTNCGTAVKWDETD